MHPSTESQGFSALLLAKANCATLAKEILLSHGFDVLSLSNAAAASEQSKHRRFDLAVYDEEVRGALEVADYNNKSLHRVAIGLLSRNRSSLGTPLHFVLRKPLSAELLDKAVKAAFAPIAADRRTSFRHDANIQIVSCLLHHGDRSRHLQGATVVNISLTGLCMETNEMLPQHSRIEFMLPLPFAYGRVRVAGRVVWSHTSGRSGIKLTDIAAADQRRLEDWADAMYGKTEPVATAMAD
jgi:hypothetical protein